MLDPLKERSRLSVLTSAPKQSIEDEGAKLFAGWHWEDGFHAELLAALYTNAQVHQTWSAFRCNVLFAFQTLFTTKDTKNTKGVQNESLDALSQPRGYF
jgi:hypothetical protein